MPNLPEWAPDEVQVGAQSVKSVENFFGSSRDAETHSIGGGFAKHGKRFYTDVYAFFATRRENETHLLPKTHTELGLDIVHELYLDDFDVSAYVSINNLESRRDKRDDASDRSVSGGISISYAPGDTPALSLSADLYQDTADFFFDEFSYRSHEYSLQAEAELLHLFHFWEDRNPGRSSAFNLTLNAYHGWNEYREAALPSKNNETRALIRLTNRF